MVGKTGICLLVLLLATAGCSLLGGGGLKPGDTAEGDLGAGVEIEELIPDAEDVLLAAGFVVEDDWAAIEFPLAKSDDGISLLVEENRMDPVIVVVDAQGAVLVAGDDWDESLDAFVSLDAVPEGARAIVFDLNGDDRALFTIEAAEAEDYWWTLDMDSEVESFTLGDKENELMEEMLYDMSEMYRDDWETCRVIPFSVDGDKWVRIAVESEIDCIMAIAMVDRGGLTYIDYDDDTNGMNPAFSGELEAGDYLCVVNTYGGSDDAEFTVSLTEMDPDDMTADIVQAENMDEWYTGEFREGSMVLAYWPEVGDYWGIYPEEQVVVFEFSIEEDGEYVFDASCFDDTKMAIIDQDMTLIDYNDDGPEGFDPQLTLQLSPGFYAALVTPYSESSTEFVDFSYYMAAPLVRDQATVPMNMDEYTSSNLYFTMIFESGQTYEIFAESNVDLTLTVVDAAGEVYFSDDDGGDFNPYLEIEATRQNSGPWDIDVESYGGAGINDNVHFVARPLTEGAEDVSAPVQVGL